MRVKRLISVMIMAFWGAILCFSSAFGQDGCSKDDVVAAVGQAVDILESQGSAGLQQVGAIRFCEDNYVFVNEWFIGGSVATGGAYGR